MDAVILMVGKANEPGIYDLEVFPDVPARELAEAIASAMNWTTGYE